LSALIYCVVKKLLSTIAGGHMRGLALVCVIAVMPLAATADIPLQNAYNAAGPGAGYDKLVILDPTETYTGGLTVSGGECAVWGDGAVVNLAGSHVFVTGGARFDAIGVVFRGGVPGVTYDAGSGRISHCTFYGNVDAVNCSLATSTKISSSIFSHSSHYGFVCHEHSPRWLAYNCAWSNTGGNYYQYCPG
jgi:hypothetical protein